MPITGNWIFTASMDVDADKEVLFNEVYDTEHIPYLSKVPGVVQPTCTVSLLAPGFCTVRAYLSQLNP